MTAVAHNFVSVVGDNFQPEPEENVFGSLFGQYERVVFQSLITSFGLDAFIKDQVGGDVDTVHNVRNGIECKSSANEEAYENRGEYNSTAYHSNSKYKEANKQYSQQRKEGGLKDAYTGKMMKPNESHDLDHVISAKEIHEDRGRLLSGLKGEDLANSAENLKATTPHTNRSKKADSMVDFLEKHGGEYTDEQKEMMRKADQDSRASYNSKINIAYYTSPKFWKDTGKAAAEEAGNMGLRQALGFVMTEVWFAVKDALASAADGLEAKLKAVAKGIEDGFRKAKEKFKTLLAKFGEGAVSGVLSSLSTTLCNIFSTTAKNIVRIIRLTWASIVEATTIIIFNPDDLPFSERMRAVLKIIATGASVVLGATVQEAVRTALLSHISPLPGLKTGVDIVNSISIGQRFKLALPGLDTLVDIVSVFAGSLCTGFLTVSLLYLIDSDPFNGILTKGIDDTIRSYKAQATLFREHAAKLANLDISKFEQEAALYHSVALNLETAQDAHELNTILQQAMQQIGVKIPWGDRSFDGFMRDPNAVLHFEA